MLYFGEAMTPQLAMEALQDMDARDVLIDALLEAGWLDENWSMAQLRVGARRWAEAVVAELFKEHWSTEPWREDLSWLREDPSWWREGADPGYWRGVDPAPQQVIVSPQDYRALQDEFRRSEPRLPGSVTLTGIDRNPGPIRIVSDERMPPGRGALVDLWDSELRPQEERWQREVVDRVSERIRRR